MCIKDYSVPYDVESWDGGQQTISFLAISLLGLMYDAKENEQQFCGLFKGPNFGRRVKKNCTLRVETRKWTCLNSQGQQEVKYSHFSI